MMKNNGIIITLIIILSIIIIGLIVFLCLTLNGRLHFGFRNFGVKSKKVIFDTTYEVESIDNLEILSKAGDVNFEESTDDKIRVLVYGENENDLNVDLNENKLKVNYANYKKVNFGFNFYLNDIIIYIPKDYSKQINIDMNYGDIKAIDLENATMNIKEDCGDIKLGKVKDIDIKNSYGDIDIEQVLDKTKIEAKCGDIKLGKVKDIEIENNYGDIDIGLISDKFTIEANCGDIKLDRIEISENSSIKSNLGNVKIKETNDIYIEAKTDLGDVKVNTNNRHSEIILKIDSDCGDIKVGN